MLLPFGRESRRLIALACRRKRSTKPGITLPSKASPHRIVLGTPALSRDSSPAPRPVSTLSTRRPSREASALGSSRALIILPQPIQESKPDTQFEVEIKTSPHKRKHPHTPPPHQAVAGPGPSSTISQETRRLLDRVKIRNTDADEEEPSSSDESDQDALFHSTLSDHEDEDDGWCRLLTISGLSPNNKKAKRQRLCPFCDEPLPDHPSRELEAMLRSLRKKGKKRMSRINPDALNLGARWSARFCLRHVDERESEPVTVDGRSSRAEMCSSYS